MISSKTQKSQAARAVAPASVGRPKKQSSDDKIVHDALLIAADECLATEASTRIPVRRIAAKAGVNQAMVNYYFSSKGGLLSAVFEKNFTPVLGGLKAFLKEVTDSTDEEARGRDYIEELITLIEHNFSKSPALFVIMHTDMVEANSETINHYRDRHSARGYSTIVRIVDVLMKRGLCRNDISPSAAAYNICCAAAMPYMVSPIFEKAFAGEMGGEAAEARRRATAQLFKAPAPSGSPREG
jgi:AcrR family transcriptional regulator